MSTARPQRRQKQKAQKRLGIYGSYFAHNQSQEEEGDDGDYREQLTATELRKRRAEEEREAKEKEELELKEKEERERKEKEKADAPPHKKLKVSSSDGSSQEVDIVGSEQEKDKDVRWANHFLMQSQEDEGSSGDGDAGASTPSLSYSLSPSSGGSPFSFNIVLPEWEEGASPSSKPQPRGAPPRRKLKKQESKVTFNEVVEMIDKKGHTCNFRLAPGEDRGMQYVRDDDASPPPPPPRRNILAQARAKEKALRLDLDSSDEDDDEEEDDEESTDDKKDDEEEKEHRSKLNGDKRSDKGKGKGKEEESKAVDKPLLGSAKASPKKTAAFFHRACLKHLVPKDHCEVPERLSITIKCIEELYAAEEARLALFEAPAQADLRWVKAVHDAAYVRKMSERTPAQVSSQAIVHATQTTQEMLNPECGFWTDTYMSHGSWAAALYAAGSVIEAVDLVTRKSHRNAICAVRPPGHHCGRSGRTGEVKSQGFCLLNNVAIGAKYALLKHDLERIAIVDFDVHAGNGTEDIFSGDDNFLFISVHAVGESFYPETGLESEGNIFNLPLPHCTTAETYRKEFKKVIKKLDDFAPQFLFLSSGFDGHKSDPIRGPRKKEGFALTGLDYHYITTQLLEVAERHCEGKVVSVLEGGYDVGSRTKGLAESFRAHVMALMGCSEDDVSAKPSTTTAAAASPNRRSRAKAHVDTKVDGNGREKEKPKAVRVSSARGRPKPPPHLLPKASSSSSSSSSTKKEERKRKRKRGSSDEDEEEDDDHSESEEETKRKENESKKNNEDGRMSEDDRKSEAKGSPVVRRARRSARGLNGSSDGVGQINNATNEEAVKKETEPARGGGWQEQVVKRVAKRTKRGSQSQSQSQSQEDGASAFTIQADWMEKEKKEPEDAAKRAQQQQHPVEDGQGVGKEEEEEEKKKVIAEEEAEEDPLFTYRPSLDFEAKMDVTVTSATEPSTNSANHMLINEEDEETQLEP